MFQRACVSSFVKHGCTLASHSNDNFWKSQLSITCLIIIKSTSKPLNLSSNAVLRQLQLKETQMGFVGAHSPHGESMSVSFLINVTVSLCVMETKPVRDPHIKQ